MIYWTGVDNWDMIITNAQKHNMRTTTAFSDFMGIYQLSVENKLNRISDRIESYRPKYTKKLCEKSLLQQF